MRCRSEAEFFLSNFTEPILPAADSRAFHAGQELKLTW